MPFRSHTIFITCSTGNLSFPSISIEVKLNALMVVWDFMFIVGRVGSLTVDRMIEKAWRLIESGRVERISEDSWSVVGDHGTYTVARDYKGRVTCNCPGFRSKKRCSHSTAVIILTKLKR